MLPQVVPAISRALAEARLVTISSDGQGAPEATTGNITGVIQTVLAAQLVAKGGLLERETTNGAAPRTPAGRD